MQRLTDIICRFIIFSGALISGTVICLIFLVLVVSAFPFFLDNGLEVFFQPWDPVSGKYGIFPMLAGTLFISVPALLLALPFSLGFAVFACETGPTVLKKPAMAVIRVASAIPTVVYAFVGVFFLIPHIRSIAHSGSGYSVVSACLVLAVLISPTMIFFFHDSIQAVDGAIKAGGDALGATRSEKILFLVLPAAGRGIFAGIFLGLGRAVGDTMISLMLAGNNVSVPGGVWDGARTLTAHIALVMAADYESPEFRSIFACGLALYLFTGMLSALARVIHGRK